MDDLGPIILPPTPKPGRNPVENLARMTEWTRQCEQAVRKIAAALNLAIGEVNTLSDSPGLPAGGATAQVLAKNSGTGGDAGWFTPHYIPVGGTTGQVLKKNSGADFDASFAKLLGSATSGTTTGAIALDLTSPQFQTVVLTGNPTFSTTNRANGAFASLKIDANGSSRSLAFSASWRWLGTNYSTGVTLASGKLAVLSLTCYGTAESDILAVFAVEP